MKSFRKISVLFLLLLCFQTAQGAWVKQNLKTFAWLHDVYFLNEKNGWIAGSGGTLLKTKDGGETWDKAKSFTEDTIRQIYFSDENAGWLLCERNLYNRGANSPSYLLRTTDGGETWEKAEFSNGGRERIVKIVFDKYEAALAFGEGGVLFTLQPPADAWKKTSAPTRFLLLDGAFTDDSNGVIVGAGGTILFSEDAGANWKQANVFGEKEGKFNSVFFVNAKTGWTAGTSGKIFQTLSGGKTWREQKSGIGQNLNDIFFTTTSNGWAVGDEGLILRTVTGGNVWFQEDSKSRHRLEKVYFNGRKGFAVGFGGTLLVYPIENASAQKPLLKN